jgi:lipopolysaccharide export LptBFGC system permease protein LptF
MTKKKKVEFKFLVLIVIICFLLSLLIFFAFDTPSSTMNQNSRNIQNEITSQDIERLEREGITDNDLEKMLNKYNKKKKR